VSILAIDVGGTNIKYALVDREDRFFSRGVIPTAIRSLDDFRATIMRIYEPLKEQVEGIAFSMPGIIDAQTGFMYSGGSLSWIHNIAMAGEVGQQGAAAAGMAGALLNIFSFVALIAINLAVMNLLPIPALDGGQILFLLVGGIYHFFTHRRIDQKYLGYINMAGFFCLIALMVVVAVSDVNKLIL